MKRVTHEVSVMFIQDRDNELVFRVEEGTVHAIREQWTSDSQEFMSWLDEDEDLVCVRRSVVAGIYTKALKD